MEKIKIKGRLSYGVKGLSAIIYTKDGDKKLGEILLSNDDRTIFTFLGYDYDRFCEGFNTKEEIFEFSIDTKYFKRERFLMENLSHKDRKRNRKRQTYHEFLNYVSDNNVPDRADINLSIDFIDSFFIDADLKSKVKKYREYEVIRKAIHEKFNGHIIMEEFPELDGKKLGKWIGDFKREYDEWNDFVLAHTKEEIIIQFKKFYEG